VAGERKTATPPQHPDTVIHRLWERLKPAETGCWERVWEGWGGGKVPPWGEAHAHTARSGGMAPLGPALRLWIDRGWLYRAIPRTVQGYPMVLSEAEKL
jgi:hypothetical protein